MFGGEGASGRKWGVVLSAAAIGVQMLSAIILARLLGPTESGKAIMAITFLGASSLLSEVGLGQAYVQRSHVTPFHFGAVAITSLTLGTSVFFLIVANSEKIATFLNEESLGPLIEFGACAFLLRTFSAPFDAAIQRQCLFKEMGAIELASAFGGQFLIALPLALITESALAPVAGLLAATITRSLLLRAYSPAWLQLRTSYHAIRDLLPFSGWFSFSRALNYFATQIDTLLIGGMVGVNAAAYYGRAFQLITAPANLIGQALSNVAFPHYSRRRDAGDDVAISALSLQLFVIGAISIIAPVLFINAKPIVELLFGEAWIPMVSVLSILVIVLPMRVGYKALDPAYKALNLMRERTMLQAFYAVMVILAVYMGKDYGIATIAGLVSSAIVIHLIISSVILARHARSRRGYKYLIISVSAWVGGFIVVYSCYLVIATVSGRYFAGLIVFGLVGILYLFAYLGRRVLLQAFEKMLPDGSPQ